MADLIAFGLEPQDPPEDESDEPAEPDPQWPECDDCEYVGPEVKARIGQPVPLCTACFAEREGLL
ncbi:hypothetical protein ACLI4Z_16400 [Natrialbaceae archaeon A-arb3/5]